MNNVGYPRKIAYFSMEIGIEARIPTYSGGLGVRHLLHRKGYFHQSLDANGWQTEEPVQ